MIRLFAELSGHYPIARVSPDREGGPRPVPHPVRRTRTHPFMRSGVFAGGDSERAIRGTVGSGTRHQTREKVVAVQDLAPQRLPHPPPPARIDAAPVRIPLRQVSPRTARARDPHHRFHKRPVGVPRSSSAASPAVLQPRTINFFRPVHRAPLSFLGIIRPFYTHPSTWFPLLSSILKTRPSPPALPLFPPGPSRNHRPIRLRVAHPCRQPRAAPARSARRTLSRRRPRHARPRARHRQYQALPALLPRRCHCAHPARSPRPPHLKKSWPSRGNLAVVSDCLLG